MAYTNFTNCTEQEYLDIIYSQDDKNRIRIWFNNVELEDAGEYCESLSGTNRITPNDGAKRFSLSNFVAKEYDLVLRDLPAGTTIADQVKISIGTLVGENTYEDVPIGIFNIQDTPVTDQNKITIKLRDNRVKFDFGYNAKPLIDAQGGSATYKQILNDICTKAGVTNDVTTFNGESIAVSIYDSTIKGSTYVAYIAEQAGAVPIITREGHLNFIYLNNLKTWRIPLSIVEKYEIGTPFEVERVVYESGIIKYQTSPDETLETLYLDAANPYISSQAQVNAVFTIMNGFTIDSATTGKILGNPAIDPYDLIEIYDDDTDDTILKTLANNTYTFNGVHRHTFDTTIGEEERKENVTVSSEATARRWAKTEIDNLNVTVTIATGKVDEMEIKVDGGSEYNLTTDTTFQANKEYFIKDGNEYIEYPQYKEYLGDRTGNPSELELYEPIFEPTYIATDDTTFESGKTYYEYDSETDTYSEYTGSTSGSPVELGLFELTQEIVDYELTEDTTFTTDKDYYEKQYDIGDTIPSNTYYEEKIYNGIENDYTEITNALRNKADVSSVQSVETSVKTLQTNTYSKTQVQEIANGNGYFKSEDTKFGQETIYYTKSGDDYVVYTGSRTGSPSELGLYEFGQVSAVISTEATFNKDGMRYTKTNGKTESLINLNGLEVDNLTRDDTTGSITNREIGLYAGYVPSDATFVGDLYKGQTIVYTKNLISRGYTEVGVHGRFEEYAGPNNENGVGFFII